MISIRWFRIPGYSHRLFILFVLLLFVFSVWTQIRLICLIVSLLLTINASLIDCMDFIMRFTSYLNIVYYALLDSLWLTIIIAHSRHTIDRQFNFFSDSIVLCFFGWIILKILNILSLFFPFRVIVDDWLYCLSGFLLYEYGIIHEWVKTVNSVPNMHRCSFRYMLIIWIIKC